MESNSSMRIGDLRRVAFILILFAAVFNTAWAEEAWRPKGLSKPIPDYLLWGASGIFHKTIIPENSTEESFNTTNEHALAPFIHLNSVELIEDQKNPTKSYWVIKYSEITEQPGGTRSKTDFVVKANELSFPNKIDGDDARRKMTNLPKKSDTFRAALQFIGIEPAPLIEHVEKKITDVMQDAKGKEFRLEDLAPTSHLATKGEDLTQKAMRGELDIIVGRKKSIRAVLRRLRDKLPGAIVTGESGVGKTALAEEIARMMVFEPEKLPKDLRGHRVVNVDAGLIKGQEGHQFVSGMQKTFNELLAEAADPKDGIPVILVFDEFHTMIGGGTSVGNPNGIEQTFKTFMQKNPHVKIIGMTTNDEYYKHVASDQALVRRFGTTPIILDEIAPKDTAKVLSNFRLKLKDKFGLGMTKKVTTIAQELSEIYMPGLQPGKSQQLINSTALSISDQIEYGERDPKKRDITKKDIEKTLRDEMNLPLVGKKFRKELLTMKQKIESRLFGQPHAVTAIVDAYKNRYTFQNPDEGPIGVFLLAGETGTGKSELGKAVAEAVTGDEKNLVRINLGEVKDITQIIGRPGELGLAHGVKSQPFSVVLLDELDQASPEIRKLLYTVVQDGYLTDFEGKKIDFRHTMILGTTNAGITNAGKKKSNSMGFTNQPDTESDEVRSGILENFDRAFAARFKVIAFNEFSHAIRVKVARLRLTILNKKLQKSQNTRISYDDAILDHIARYADPTENGRGIKKYIDDHIASPISQAMTRYEFEKPYKKYATVKLNIETGDEGMDSIKMTPPPIKHDYLDPETNSKKQAKTKSSTKNRLSLLNSYRWKRSHAKRNQNNRIGNSKKVGSRFGSFKRQPKRR